MARPRRIDYAELFGHISAADAEAEPAADQLFIEPGPYPKITISTQLVIDGFVLNVTLNDMQIGDAVALLKRRRATPPTPPKPRPKPTYEIVWLELD
jgi:hypothetical protein